MKSRSHHHRLQSTADDWVDESWTVDCVCGVNFDDGEEMVNCDECGVWVHTRCSRYVKGDDVFVCHKCKTKNSRSISSTATATSNEAQKETEVAQFLVELPTKTVMMGTSLAANANVTTTANNHNPPCRRPFRLWTDIPMEERVHVQGIPGGDPSLFHGLSTVFTPQLWKSAGYIPKSFSFQYKEFPCWDNGDHKGLHLKEDNEKPRGNTEAGPFFYTCKEAILTDPSTNSLQIGDGQVGFDCKASSKEMNKCESDCTVGMRSSQICMKQESCCLHPVPVQSTKRRKEDLWTCKDRSGKRAKSMDEDTNGRRSPHASESGFRCLSSTYSHHPNCAVSAFCFIMILLTYKYPNVFAPTSDAKQLEFYEDGGLFVFKADSRSLNNRSSREIDDHSYIADHSNARKPNMPAFNCDVIAVGESSEALCPDKIGVCSVGRVAEQDETSLKGQSLSEVSSKTVNVVMPLAGCGVENALANVETEDGPEIDVTGNNAVATSLESPPPLGLPTVPELYNHVLQACNGDNSSSSVQPVVKLLGKEDDGNNKKPLLFQSSSDINDERIFSDSVLYPSKISGDTLSVPLSSHNKAQRGEIGPVVHCGLRTGDADGSSVEEFHIKQETKDSSDNRETKYVIGFDADQSKSDIIVLASQALLKMDSKAPFDDSKCEDAQIPDPNVRRTSISENKVAVTKGSHPPSTSERARDEEKHNLHKKMVIENEKNLSNSTSKASYSGRSSQDSSKQVDPELKISGLNSSSKASFSRNISTNSSCGEANETFNQSQALYGQNKMSASELVQRGEKLNHSNIQPSSKAIQNHAGSVLPSTGPSAPAMLSDEELALLLHQELNSSLRVPRVPRVRHASSLPQLASPSGSGLLIKRTSNSGGKDHIVVSKRKHKDTLKDEVCKSHEAEDDSKKLEKLLSSPDQRKPDVACIVDSSVKEEDHGSSTAHSVSRNLSFISTSTANSGPSSSPEDPRLSFTRGSPRMDGYSVGRVVHLTLPGLINEIMSKGRRMTYEELCNAVLPHWHNLRKHNGERYAYSSHSQAVLDCLRNRHEWARLVDRGPKTNFNRKRRKLEAEESDDNEWIKNRWAREEGMNLEYPKEEFPKGKRKARKRRRLALQGRGAVEDVRKRRKAYSSDEEAGPFSDSSEDGMFSDDETQGGGACPVGSNASVSSDEDGRSN